MTRNNVFFAFALSLSIALLPAHGASAQGLDKDKSTFIGPYLGVSGGYGRYKEKIDVNGASDFQSSTWDVDYGALIGWRASIGGNFIAGVEGFGLFTSAQDIERFNPAVNGVSIVTIDFERSFGGGPTVGYMLSPSSMLFANLSYVNTRIRTRVNDLGAGNLQLKGVRFGGGMEFALSPNFSFRGEAYATDYGNLDFFINDPVLGLLNVSDKFNQIRFAGSFILSF